MALSKQKWLYDNDESYKEKTSIKMHTIVHTINLGDVEDPDLYVAEPIIEWKKSEKGKFVMENSKPTPSLHRHINHNTYGYQFNIVAYFDEETYAWYKLKYE